jgi:2Fe-2S ferredoxin
MPKVIFVQVNGKEDTVEVVSGQSVMQAAVGSMIGGIVGECGGSCSCATCHAYVDPQWTDKIPAATPDELAMLEGAVHVRPNSRLTCQIKVEPDLDGLTVHLPESQY